MKEKPNGQYKELEQSLEKKLQQKDKRKKPKMTVSGKSVFKLQSLIATKKPKK